MARLIKRDSHEENENFVAIADEQEKLEVGPGDHSYDFEITTIPDGEETFAIERKEWSDFKESWKKDRLQKQCSHVDILIVEFGPMDAMEADPEDQFYQACRKRLHHLQEEMPVITTTGPKETARYLQRLEQRGSKTLRANQVVRDYGKLRHTMLGTFPGVNPDRALEEGKLGDKIEEKVDWDLLVEALNLREWMDIPYLGIRTITKIRDRLGEEEKG